MTKPSDKTSGINWSKILDLPGMRKDDGSHPELLLQSNVAIHKRMKKLGLQ